MKRPAIPTPPSAPVQANSSGANRGGARPFLPPALTTNPRGIKRASTQKRRLIGGDRNA
jgi:hypothetical protein